MSVERSEKILTRQIEWVKSADAKIPPLYAINVAMLAVLVAMMKALESWTYTAAISSALAVIALLVSLTFLVLTIFPRLDGPKSSNVFFGGIAQKAEAVFIKEVKNVSDEEFEDDLLTQAYRNAEIANAKYSHIKKAFIVSFIAAPLWVIAVYAMYF